MSGGSYEYLYGKFAEDWLSGVPVAAQQMADRLAALGYHDAAVETNALIAQARAAHARMEASLTRLTDVWKAVEWFDSSDWGLDSVEAAIAKYRGES